MKHFFNRFLAGIILASLFGCSETLTVPTGAEEPTDRNETPAVEEQVITETVEENVPSVPDDSITGPVVPDGVPVNPVDPDTGLPVPQDAVPDVIKSEFGFTLTIPDGAQVSRNGVVEHCYVPYDVSAEPDPAADMGADAGAPPAVEPAPAQVCIRQYRLDFEGIVTDPLTGEGRLYDFHVVIDPADDDLRNPNITTLSYFGPAGQLILNHNVMGGGAGAEWITDAAAIRPIEAVHPEAREFQFQLNAQLAGNVPALKSLFEKLLADFGTVK